MKVSSNFPTKAEVNHAHHRGFTVLAVLLLPQS